MGSVWSHLEPGKAAFWDAEFILNLAGSPDIAQLQALLGSANHTQSHKAGIAGLFLQTSLEFSQARKFSCCLGFQAMLLGLPAEMMSQRSEKVIWGSVVFWMHHRMSLVDADSLDPICTYQVVTYCMWMHSEKF